MTSTLGRAALLFLLALIIPTSARAQQATPTPTPTPAPLPDTDVFVVDLTNKGGALRFGLPQAVTTWEGYDNQPSFTPDGRALLYTSIRADAQADIYRYDLRDRSTARLTETRESEFSPTVTPDGRFFSVVRVEADGTQRLWKFPVAGGGEPALVLEKIKPVGYHAWVDERRLALFVLGEPHTLQLAEVGTERAEVVAQNIGRALHRVPRRRDEVSFVHKISDGEWLVKVFDARTRATRTLVKTLPGSEDLAWTPGGVVLMAEGSKLFKFDPARDKGWQEVADFAAAGLRSITRLAVSPKGDRLALVAQGVARRAAREGVQKSAGRRAARWRAGR